VQLDQGLLAFSGQLGEEQLSGQLRVRRLPADRLEPFLQELPIDVAGRLNVTATLAGTLNNT
jgi:translocation and assembly module TamB